MSAAYSLAADTFGQEAIITALSLDPDFVNRFLDLLTDRVLQVIGIAWLAVYGIAVYGS